MTFDLTLENKYLIEASDQSYDRSLKGEVEWICPSNIALIKYWGKKPLQIPVNPSVSFTLAKCNTQMRVDFFFDRNHNFSLEFEINGALNEIYKEKIEKYLLNNSAYFPFIPFTKFKISSANSFPVETGIASSASSFAALALCLCSIDLQLSKQKKKDEHFFKKASFMARLGSGSACRSVYGGTVLWGQFIEISESSDESAIPVSPSNIHKIYNNYRDSILIIDSGQKLVSSSTGHMLMEKHPFLSGRIMQANKNILLLMKALKTGDLNEFIRVVENESLSLHSLMLSSDPGYILLKPNTIEAIEKIRKFRNENQIPVCFTLDAGANIHLLYPEKVNREVKYFIENELKHLCEKGATIDDHLGNGPVKII